MNQNTFKTISTTCGGRGPWLTNLLSNAGPGFGSIKSLFPYNTSSPSPSSFGFPGILQSGGAKGRRKKYRRTRRRTNANKKRRKHTRKH
jgi:hypothetical protein